MERVTGIEPVYPTWKAGALADVLHPQGVGQSEDYLEKIGTLKKGEKISKFLYLYYTKNFYKNQLICE